MQDSIFTKIIKGEIPSHKIYEDDRTFAFLDIHPVTPGHVLIVPKRQVPFVWDLPDDDYQALMATCKLVARRLREVLQVPFVGTQIVGVDVPHAHAHIVPFSSMEEFRRVPDMQAEPNHEALANIAKTLVF